MGLSLPQGFGPSAGPPAQLFGPSLPPGFGGSRFGLPGPSMPGPFMGGASYPGFNQWNPFGGRLVGGHPPGEWDRRDDYDGRLPHEPDYLTDPDYCRVTRVADSIYLTNKTGGLPEGLHDRLRITSVICVSESHEVEPPTDPYCDFRRIPVPNDPSEEGPNIIRYFDEICELIKSEEDKGGRVLVQSLKGRSRGPTVVIAYLMKCKGMKLCDAFGLVSGQRPIIRPFVAFWKQLIMYESEIHGKNSVSL